MRALPAPSGSASSSRRLQVLIGLAAVIAIGIALWPRSAVPESEVVASADRPGNYKHVEHPAAPSSGPVPPPRLVHTAAVDLFAGHSWYRPPPPPPPRAPENPPPPTAPPFPYSYLGQYERPGDKPVYFLQRGDSVFDVQVGQVLDGVWNIDAVAEGRMRLTYTPLKLTQVLSLGSTP